MKVPDHTLIYCDNWSLNIPSISPLFNNLGILISTQRTAFICGSFRKGMYLRNMEGLLAFLFACVFLLHILQRHEGDCNPVLYPSPGSSNITTVKTDEKVALICDFTDHLNLLGESYLVRWKHGNDLIGTCSMYYPCFKDAKFANDSRYNLTQTEELVFELQISNARSTDAGLFECSMRSAGYRTSRVMEVFVHSVVPLHTTENPNFSSETIRHDNQCGRESLQWSQGKKKTKKFKLIYNLNREEICELRTCHLGIPIFAARMNIHCFVECVNLYFGF